MHCRSMREEKKWGCLVSRPWYIAVLFAFLLQHVRALRGVGAGGPSDSNVIPGVFGGVGGTEECFCKS